VEIIILVHGPLAAKVAVVMVAQVMLNRAAPILVAVVVVQVITGVTMVAPEVQE
jgi:Flp pilus assembly pilin Flp